MHCGGDDDDEEEEDEDEDKMDDDDDDNNDEDHARIQEMTDFYLVWNIFSQLRTLTNRKSVPQDICNNRLSFSSMINHLIFSISSDY